MRGRYLCALCVALSGLFAFGAVPALAQEFRVSNDGSCPNADAVSIQQAVTEAGPDDTVKVCPGVYPEQVVIPPGKDRLKLESLEPQAATIKAPPAMVPPQAIVRDNGSQDVTLRDFVITGPGPATSCADNFWGVRVDGGGSARIYGNHITEIRDVTVLGGCQAGVAIQVGRAREAQTGSATIFDNVIDHYQKNGPTIDNAGSSARVYNNRIDGGGPSTIIARNGLQIGRGATAEAFSNEIFGNEYVGSGPPAAGDTDDSNDATGIITFEENGGVRLHDNDIHDNDLGIDFGTTTNLEIWNNNSYRNRFDGIRAESDTSQNLVKTNKLTSNGVHDCHDDSVGPYPGGVANIWQNNKGVTENRPGLCRGKS